MKPFDFFRNDLPFRHLLEDVQGRTFLMPEQAGWSPAANVVELANAYRIDLFCPGRDKTDFTLQVEDGILRISSQVAESKESQEDASDWIRKEFTIASFARSFRLPEEVDAERISANYANGVLQVHLPRREQAEVAWKKTVPVM